MNNQELVKKILELVGGKENISNATHCMTRLRLTLKDDSKVQIDALKKIDGVMGVVEDETLQVVLGPGKVNKVYDEFVKLVGNDSENTSDETVDWQANKSAIKDKQKDNSFKRMLRIISNIFIPLLPAIIAAGLFSGFGNLIGQIWPNQIAAGTGIIFIIQKLFELFGTGFLTYFAIFTGINAAKEFGATPALGGMIGGISIGEGIVAVFYRIRSLQCRPTTLFYSWKR